MRVVTLNLWMPGPSLERWSAEASTRLDLIGDELAALSPDVVCVQETWVGAAAHLAYRAGLSRRPARR